jgi:polyvinyl alcohol dehydrogenase (cytochrome)
MTKLLGANGEVYVQGIVPCVCAEAMPGLTSHEPKACGRLLDPVEAHFLCQRVSRGDRLKRRIEQEAEMPLRVIGQLACLMLSIAAPGISAAQGYQNWPSWSGPGLGNQHAAVAETILNPGNVGMLKPKWVFTTRGDVGATPTVESTTLYATDDGGGVYSIDTQTGQAIWSHLVSDYTGNASSVSHSSPAIGATLLIITDRRSGTVMALNKLTGALVWKTLVDSNPYASMTNSPVIYGDTVYVGSASIEEYIVTVQPHYTPSFRGRVTALSLSTGQIRWQTPMVPPGYTGGPVWGSAFAISPTTGTLFAATGNNYSVPPAVGTCLQQAGSIAQQLACLDPADYVDAIVALDLSNGSIKWGERLQGEDTYTNNCALTKPVQPCPVPPGKDYDFGAAPNLIHVTQSGQSFDLVGAGQKSGTYWALNPATGATVWSRQAGPGGQRGGILWGAAVDYTRIYVAENDFGHVAYRLGPKGVAATNGGSWAALDLATGSIIWQVAVPAAPTGAPPDGAEGSVSVANGVVYAGTTTGEMVALNAATGATLWTYASGGSVGCGPAIVNGVVYWGSGDPYGKKNKQLYAFSLGGK